MFEPWMLAAMEEHGYMDTDEGKTNRLARYLATHGSDEIGNEEFLRACEVCDVNPHSVDLNELQRKINKW